MATEDGTYDGTGTVLLVVDDDDFNCSLARLVLARNGYRVVIARDGLEALRSLAFESVAIVLMDCEMPVMDGFDATRRLREHPDSRVASTVVVGLTATAREGCLEAGMDDHLGKPYTPHALLAIVERWRDKESRVARRGKASPAG